MECFICVRNTLLEGFHGKQRHRQTAEPQNTPKRFSATSEAEGLQLLVSQLEGHPGVEHGGPQLAPHQVIGQPEDLGCKLSSGIGGEDCGAAKTCSRRVKMLKTVTTMHKLSCDIIQKSQSHRLACGGMTRHLVHPSPEWEVGSWWPDMPCFQTWLDRGHYFCRQQPQKQWARRHLRNNTHMICQQQNSHFLKRKHKQLKLQMNTDLRTLLWCGVSRLDLCVQTWLSGCRESRTRRRPSWFSRSEPCPRWSPSGPPPCRWPQTPAAAADTTQHSVTQCRA